MAKNKNRPSYFACPVSKMFEGRRWFVIGVFSCCLAASKAADAPSIESTSSGGVAITATDVSFGLNGSPPLTFSSLLKRLESVEVNFLILFASPAYHVPFMNCCLSTSAARNHTPCSSSLPLDNATVVISKCLFKPPALSPFSPLSPPIESTHRCTE